MRKTMFYGADLLIFMRAKELRNRLTNSEMKLWGYLREKPLAYKFRRQHPMGIYIVDFYCHALKLVIEIDGNIHDLENSKRAEKEVQFQYEEVIISINKLIMEKNNKLTPPLGGRGV